MLIFLRLIMCGVYVWTTNWFIQNVGGFGDIGANHQLWIATWIIVGMKLLFIVAQDKSGFLHFLKLVLDTILIYNFAQDVLGIVLVGLIILPAGFAWSDLTLASRMATGHGPLEVRRALQTAITKANRTGADDWTW